MTALTDAIPGVMPLPDPTRLRRRDDADLPEMLDLWVASWRVAYPEIDFDARRPWLVNQIAALEQAGAVTICVFQEGALAGFVVIHPETGWLDQICVGDAYKGKGCAEALMTAAREMSPGVIRLDVNADNMRAIRFYERNRFVQVGRGENTLSGRATIQMEWRTAE